MSGNWMIQGIIDVRDEQAISQDQRLMACLILQMVKKEYMNEKIEYEISPQGGCEGCQAGVIISAF